MPVVRKTQIENLQQMSGEELERFLEALPAGKEDIEELFDYLEERLERQDCNHSLRFAMQFIMENKLNFPKVSGWLTSNAGVCDCKVMERIAPDWRIVFG
jgi:Protein of unknown function (DUF2695)